jgi:UDP-N-acetylmuramoyl-tripeptide--D-alanyl-D-alanine ligase
MVRARIPLHGEHLAPLVALALGAAAACGVPVERALQATSTFTPPLGRLSPVPGPNGSMFVLDTFKSRLPNAIAALEAFGEMDARRRIAVLGEVQDRDHDVDTYTPIGDLLLGSVDVVLAVGRCAGPLRDLLRGTSLQHHFMTATCVDDAAAQLGPQLREGDLVLMHGADHQGLQHVKWLLDKEAMRLAVSSNGHLQDEDAS